MPAYLNAYLPALWSMTGMVFLFLIQFAVADLARVRANISPGHAVADDHDSFVFRAERAHANTIENFAAFVLAALLAVVTTTSPSAVNALTITFVAARGVHMMAYYFDVRLLRSISFTVGVLATTGMAGVLVRQLARA